MYESLHNHTTASDGTQTYGEVLATAKREGFGTIAFTDHDMLPTKTDLDFLRAYQGPVKWLLGCEISSGLPTELGGSKAGTIHVLGLFTDPTNAALQEHSRQALSARTERMERMVGNLRNLGFTISIDDCLEASGGDNVGRPHIVRALNSHLENRAVIAGIKDQMEAAAKTSPTIAMDYLYMLERHPSDHPYRLFLSDDAFIPGVYVDYLYSIDLDESVELIRQAGGKAAIAHWWTYLRKIDELAMEGLLRDKRLDFVEVCSGMVDHKVERYGKVLVEMAKRVGSIPQTIGIDGHSDSDIAHYANNRSVAVRTEGQTQAYIEAFKPNLDWTNFAPK
jgi:predicted metal-dependent phosphoesterase TrpH